MSPPPLDVPKYAMVFPAHAGMSHAVRLGVGETHGFPRSRGDEPSFQNLRAFARMFSPLTRG